MNDSSTGGYLLPSDAGPLEGQALLDFLQGVIVGITGLAGTMVRPYTQSEPPNIPDAGNAWCAFRIGNRPSDRFPYVQHNPNDAEGEGSDMLQRHETLHIHCSFYDLGAGGLADNLASLLRDGLSIAQNREVLTLNNMGLAYTGEPTPAPIVVKTRWLYRVDLEIVIRRQITRTYPVRNIESAQSTITTNSGLTEQIISE
jgi:hypothetical protein